MSANDLELLHHKLDEIHVALVGNPAMGHKGLVSRMEDVEKTQAEHGRKFLIATGAIAAFTLMFDWVKGKLFSN